MGVLDDLIVVAGGGVVVVVVWVSWFEFESPGLSLSWMHIHKYYFSLWKEEKN